VAKRSRRPALPESTASRPSSSAPDRSPTGAPSSRSTRAARPRRAAQPSLIERYRTLIFAGVGVIGLLIVAWLFLQSGAQAGYTCDTLLTPGPSESLTPRPPTPSPSPTPTPSPVPSVTATPSGTAAASPSAAPSAEPTPTPEATPRLGFTTTVLGRTHMRDLNTIINYAFCPPTSGDHFNVTNRGPIRAGVYPKSEEQIPGGWIHNLEHGYVVALYRCSGPDDCVSDAEMAQLQALYDQSPTSVNPSCPRKVIVARFDQMETRFALLAWGRALLTDEFDLDTALTFAQQWMDHEAVPERGLC
jgi:hypothetical protein